MRRYSGRSTEENFRRKLAELRRLVAAAGLQAEGDGVLADCGIGNLNLLEKFMREVARGRQSA